MAEEIAFKSRKISNFEGLMNLTLTLDRVILHKGKRKEEYLYSIIYYACIVSKRSVMDHTVLPANYTMHAFPS